MISRNRAALSAACSLLVVGGSGAVAAHAQDPSVAPPVSLPINQTFLTSDHGWVAIGAGAKVSLATDPITLNSIRGALKLDYSIAKGSFDVFGFPLGSAVLAQARSFKFAVRADYATTVAFAMQEDGGGRYVALFSVPKDKWQIVELNPSDFTLSDGPTDPKDPDNQLDLDKVQYLGLTDAGQIWAQLDTTVAKTIFGVETGPHVLYVADFQITAADPGGSHAAPKSPDVIDDFAHPQVDWVMIGGTTATTYSRSSAPWRGLQVSYKQSPGKFAGMLHLVGHAQLAGATKLILAVASEKAANLLIQVEESGGGKYNTKAYVPAGTTAATTIRLAFADFTPADDSKDTNGKLDMDQVSRILISDITGVSGGVTQDTDNTLYFGDMHVTR